MQTFLDEKSPRYQIPFENLPRGIVKFPSHIVDNINRDRVKFGPKVFTDEYAHKSLENQTLVWYYEGLPVAYKAIPDGIEVFGVGWEETARYRPLSFDGEVKVVQP
jgi:hypothetical protein